MIDLLELAGRAVSLFDTIAYLWLGLTVLLNAERRGAGVWLASAGLLIAGLFFAGHSALVGQESTSLVGQVAAGDLDLWWRLAWALFVVPPFLWRAVLAWYGEAWSSGGRAAEVGALLGLGSLGLVLLAAIGALPNAGSALLGSPSVGIISSRSALPLAYPVFSLACVALSLASLGRSSDSRRPFASLGRDRARPWLRATTIALLVVACLAGAAIASLVGLPPRPLAPLVQQSLSLVLALDLALAGLLGGVVVLLGRAIVGYEIFTGKALPRGDLYRHWRNGLLFAAGIGLALAGSFELPISLELRLAFAAALLAASLALQSWSTFAERDRGVARLRPFVASQRLYEGLLEADAPEVDVDTPFRALVGDVLDAEVGYLVALGSLASLTGPPLAYPRGVSLPMPLSSKLLAELSAPGVLGVPIEPRRYGGSAWAVPLSGERGLVGVLLVGPKSRGGLFVQEELELARAAGERLLDTRASAALSRRLVSLQRQRLAEWQILDQRTRRVLHDEVLPRLHAVLLTLAGIAGKDGAAADAVESLAEVHRGIADLLRELPAGRSPEVGRLGLVGALRRTVEVELRSRFDGVTWQVAPEAEGKSATLPELTAEVAFGAAREAIRNAARHGRSGDSERPLSLRVSVLWENGLRIVVEDDGVGLAGEAGAPESRGQGLALHGTLLAIVGGTLEVADVPEGGTRVTIRL